MSEDQIRYIEKALTDIKKSQDNLFVKLEELRMEVHKDHLPRINDLEKHSPSEKDLRKIKELDVEKIKKLTELFSNWRFLLKFFGMIAGVITFIVGIVYMIAQIIESL